MASFFSTYDHGRWSWTTVQLGHEREIAISKFKATCLAVLEDFDEPVRPCPRRRQRPYWSVGTLDSEAEMKLLLDTHVWNYAVAEDPAQRLIARLSIPLARGRNSAVLSQNLQRLLDWQR